MARVAVVGSLNLDLVVTSPRHPSPGETLIGGSYREFPGGKGLNQAVAAARAGGDVTIHGCVGDDGAGTTLLDVAGGDGVGVAGVTRRSEPTGRALITVSDDGENTIVVVPGANAELAPDHLDPLPLGRPEVVMAQLEIPLATVSAAFRLACDVGAITVLDPAPATDLPDELLALVDVIVPNEHEVELLGGVDRLLEAGVRTVIVTLGARGARCHDANGTEIEVPTPTVDPVDTTGAGDAFRGALAVRLAAGDPVGRALPFAAAAGALATTAAGAVPSLPRRAAIERSVQPGSATG